MEKEVDRSDFVGKLRKIHSVAHMSIRQGGRRGSGQNLIGDDFAIRLDEICSCLDVVHHIEWHVVELGHLRVYMAWFWSFFKDKTDRVNTVAQWDCSYG